MMSEFNEDVTDAGPTGAPNRSMPAEFGLSMLTFVVVASMVGSGVLTTSGYTVAAVGSNSWMLILWVVGGLTAVCGALTLAELSAALPRTGGDYVYLHEAYGPMPAFLSGWVSFLIGFAAPGAVSAFGASKYLLAPLHPPGTDFVLPERLLATALVLAFAALHVSGRRGTARVQGGITAVKVILLAAFAVAGLAAGCRNTANLADLTPVQRPARGEPARFACVHLLCIHGLECGLVPGGGGPAAAACAAARDPDGNGGGAVALPGGERRVRPGVDPRRPPRPHRTARRKGRRRGSDRRADGAGSTARRWPGP